jgi:release factor glutamine methyltransferase
LDKPSSSFDGILDDAVRALQAVSPSPRLDAEVLFMHLFGVTRSALLTRAHETLNDDQQRRYARLIERRRAGEPVAYLTGTREFWSLPISVTPAVLIPRPETELLVERALIHIVDDPACAIADLGTGSGAIALAIAKERPRSRLVAIDASAEALAVAQQNARALGVTQIDFRLGDWTAPLANDTFDVIVANPPYLRADDNHLTRGDVRHEPRPALIGGPDGLDAIRAIARQTPARLRPNGRLLLEHGYDQADAVAQILRDAGFVEPVCHVDLAGQPRVTEARRSVLT